MLIKTKNIIQISLFSIIFALSSWVTIPAAIPITMQTFAIFLSFLILGGKRSLCSILLYIFLGVLGLPVFSGFSGGLGVILGPSGGYIIGFVVSAVTYIITSRFIISNRRLFKIIALLISLIACYIFGTLWFTVLYSNSTSAFTLIKTCVLIFIPLDIIKMMLAIIVSERINKLINND